MCWPGSDQLQVSVASDNSHSRLQSPTPSSDHVSEPGASQTILKQVKIKFMVVSENITNNFLLVTKLDEIIKTFKVVLS